MKNLFRYIRFLLLVKRGQLVTAKTVPIVMADTVLQASIDVIGTYVDTHIIPTLCYIRGLDGASHSVYVESIKKISVTKNPELFL